MINDTENMENIVRYLDLPYEIKEDYELFTDAWGGMSYNMFMARVTAVAMYLRDRGIRKKAIGIRAVHTKETITACMGILLSGNYYVLLGEDMPESYKEKVTGQVRMEEIWEDVRAVTDTAYDTMSPHAGVYSEMLAALEMPAVLETPAAFEMPADHEAQAPFETPAPHEASAPSEPMYVVFTSGTTGIPKGIVKSHAAVINFIDTYVKEFGFTSRHIFGSQTPFYFDASIKDIFTVLAVRGKMVIIDAGLFMNPIQLLKYITANHINVIQWVPSALSLVASMGALGEVNPDLLEKVMFVGEAFGIKPLLQWMEAVPEAEFVNMYGFSEIAGICAFCRIRKGTDGRIEEADRPVPIGKPLSNCEIYLLDESGELITKEGVTGEIYVSSSALAEGYTNGRENVNDSLCKAAKAPFVWMQRGDMPEGRYYRTGDRACYDKEGRLLYSGRTDHQIKHMGRRIELPDIECVAADILGVLNVCCIYCDGKIILFAVGDVDRKYILRELRGKLPRYMLPHKVCMIDEIPLNKNGKKDREVLKGMAGGRK